MISWKLKRWRMLSAAAAIGLAACGQTTTDGSDRGDNTVTEDSGERGEGGDGGESGESGESGEGGNSGPG